ncbi:hypothetical protein BST23_04230 [Mycolicibacterium elephantis]|uniref:Uncharacterized protein n=1 Tax=Mycolicibacterium elephantis TaxID=81858 RepID=A0A1X0D7A6_9MYCO|nr:hypothetical protein [Mycolicibacterium elephantis]ORA68295.1 hypothetical protein BST23_04230 [Mycolicibacterium elephantis]
MQKEVAVVEPEILPVLDRTEAKKLDERIRRMAGVVHGHLEKLKQLVAEAKRGRIHQALGYPSWTAYLADALQGDFHLDRTHRRELVNYLAGEGMSQRAIASIAGVDQKTVSNDLRATEEISSVRQITGLDGRRRRAVPMSRTPRTSPITERAHSLALDLRRMSTRVDNLQADEQFGPKSEEVRALVHGDAKSLIDRLVEFDAALRPE